MDANNELLFVVVVGDELEMAGVAGPFKSRHAAENWALDSVQGCCWVVRELFTSNEYFECGLDCRGTEWVG